MKASELRIGNLIQLNPEKDWHQKNDLTVVVESISSDGINYSYFSYEHTLFWETLDDDRYSPIPLTPEWLERFGFENIGTDDYHSKPMFKKHGCDWKYCLEGYFSQYFCQGHSEPAIVGDIQYVHQLQNLYFVLTGEELTIKEPVKK